MKYLALGDSYTIGEAVKEKDSFPFQVGRKLNTTPQIIAQTGWTTTDLLSGIALEETADSYDLVTLLIGVNNQYQGKSRGLYLSDLESLFKFILSKDPTHLVCISIPNYGYTPFGREQQSYVTNQLKWYNKILKEHCLKYKGEWIDIEQISRAGQENPALLAKDSLHPSALMYTKIAELILNKIQ